MGDLRLANTAGRHNLTHRWNEFAFRSLSFPRSIPETIAMNEVDKRLCFSRNN